MNRRLEISFTGHVEDVELEQLLKDILAEHGIRFTERMYMHNRTVTYMSFELNRAIKNYEAKK